MKVATNKDSGKCFDWVSDCATLIHTETRQDGVTEFTFTGVGARDGIKACFTMPAADMADAKKFKGALVNAFGSGNRVGNLTFKDVQNITRNTIKKQRVTAPCWRGNTPLVPGLELANDVVFRLSPITPAKVYDGKIEIAADTLKKLISLRKYTPLLVAVILGAPIFAKWFPGDRFGLGLWGKSGSHKTTIAKLASAIYGLGYYEDHAVIKHGRNGATYVGAMEALLNAGMLPRILDNVKSTDPRDAQQYIAVIHAAMEGGEKLRGKKDGGLRNVEQFSTTPIVTGETKPDEASTSARVLNLTWQKADDSQALAEIQEDIRNLPIVGYHWLKYLSTCSNDLKCGFETARTKKYNEYISKNYVNVGRLATIYCLIQLVWDLALKGPFGEVFREYTSLFQEALDEAIAEQATLVTEETEVAKFLAALAELTATRPDLFMAGEIRVGTEKILG